MKNGKIVILGAGHVGSHIAYALSAGKVAKDIVLVDIVKGKALSQALDIMDSVGFYSDNVRVRAGDYCECADADIIFVAIGCPRLPGQTRLDVLDSSAEMLKNAAEQLLSVKPKGIIVSITNPADVIGYMLREMLSYDRFRCFSSGTALDSARMKRIAADMAGVAYSKIDGYVMGEHGDSSFVAASNLMVDGKLAEEVLSVDELNTLTRKRGMDIIEGKGSTEFGIGSVCAHIADVILCGRQEIMPLSVTLCGEYGVSGAAAGVPCVLSENGIKQIVELELSASEKAAFSKSVAVIKDYINRAGF